MMMKKLLFAIPLLLLTVACERAEVIDEVEDPYQNIPSIVISDSYTPYHMPILADDIQGHSLGLDSKFRPVQAGGFSWAGMGPAIMSGASTLIGYYFGGKPGATVANKLSDALSKMIFGVKPAEEVVLLNQVLENLDGMDDKLDEILKSAEAIYRKLDEVQLNDIMAAYKSVYTKYLVFKQLNDFTYDLANSTNDLEEQTEIVTEWAKTYVNGSAAYIAVTDFLSSLKDFDYMYNGVHLNFFSAFDMIVLSNVAWECTSYDYRDAFRAEIATEVSRCLYLLTAYYDIRFSGKNSWKKNIRAVNSAAGIMEQFFNDCAVKRNPNVVCVLPGHQFEITDSPFVDPIFSITSSGLTCASQYQVFTSKEWLYASSVYGPGDPHFTGVNGSNGSLVTANEHTGEFDATCISNDAILALIEFYKDDIEANRDLTLLDIFGYGGVLKVALMENIELLGLCTDATVIIPLSRQEKSVSDPVIRVLELWPLNKPLADYDVKTISFTDRDAEFRQYGTTFTVSYKDPEFGNVWTPTKFLINSLHLPGGIVFVNREERIY